MAVSYTYGDMQNRIADELGGRADLLANSPGMTASPIQLAIQSAIGYFENDRFFFNELRQTGAFNTVLNQEFYTSADWDQIPYLKHIDKLSVFVTRNRYYMVGRTPQYMEDISINPYNNGVPIDYCYYNEQLRFYPIPNAAYPINFLGTKTFAELSAVGDTNPWVNEAEELIRCRAEFILCRDTLKDAAGALAAASGAKEAYSSLKGETFKRGAALVMRPTYF